MQISLPLLVHGGDIRCPPLLSWEEGHSPWYQARKSAPGLSWRTENCRLWLVCPCTFFEVRNHSCYHFYFYFFALLGHTTVWFVLTVTLFCLWTSPWKCLQTTDNVRHTGLPPARDGWGSTSQWEGGPVVYRDPLLWMFSRTPAIWNSNPNGNLQKDNKG